MKAWLALHSCSCSPERRGSVPGAPSIPGLSQKILFISTQLPALAGGSQGSLQCHSRWGRARMKRGSQWLRGKGARVPLGDQGSAKQISCQDVPLAPSSLGRGEWGLWDGGGMEPGFAHCPWHRRGGGCPRHGVTAVGTSGTTLPQKSKPGI